jgi:competence protein ComGC
MDSTQSKHHKASGFTMVELTTVGLIILVLIAIALPNFLEAQIRAQVTTCTADMTFLAQSLEEYYIAQRAYPPNRVAKLPTGGLAGDGTPTLRGAALRPLTTPIAYLSMLPGDYFPPESHRSNYYDYINFVDLTGGSISLRTFLFPGTAAYLIASVGPDFIPGITAGSLPTTAILYSPTNGTRSNGDLILFGP